MENDVEDEQPGSDNARQDPRDEKLSHGNIGHGSEKDEKQAYELGAFGYLEKPVDIEALGEAIRRIYQRGKRHHQVNAPRQRKLL